MRDLSKAVQIDLGMSNYEHTIDPGLDEALRGDREAYAGYAAWNFNGRVFADGDGFTCQVWYLGAPIGEITSGSLPDLMIAVSEEHGWD